MESSLKIIRAEVSDLRKCLQMVLKSEVCPETKIGEWYSIIPFAQSLGYVYTTPERDGFVMCYRIPEWKESYSDVIPTHEEGDILYCAWAVSESSRRNILLDMVKNFPYPIKELIYYKRNSNTDFKRLKLRRNEYVEA